MTKTLKCFFVPFICLMAVLSIKAPAQTDEESYSWPDDLNVHMTLLSNSEWIDIFHKSGLDNCKSWNANQTKDSPGTLVISGQLLS
mgnify:CR=1 FL=1